MRIVKTKSSFFRDWTRALRREHLKTRRDALPSRHAKVADLGDVDLHFDRKRALDRRRRTEADHAWRTSHAQKAEHHFHNGGRSWLRRPGLLWADENQNAER